jgi:hypothetical protein
MISESALVAISLVTNPNLKEAEVASIFGYNVWLNAVVSRLRSLFLLYAVAHHLGGGIPTVSRSVVQLCDATPEGWTLEGKRVKSRMLEVSRAVIKAHSLADYKASIKHARSTLKGNGISLTDLISGKDYLFPLVYSRLQRLLKFHHGLDALKVELAAHYDPTAERYLARRLKGILVGA